MVFPDFSDLFNGSRTVILDGGLGTTLEDYKAIKTSNTSLWSAECLVGPNEELEALVDTHLQFLRAGARVISTATYQCSLSTFQSAGIEARRAVELMRTAIAAAAEAKRRFLEDPSCEGHDVSVALSLGPFGGTLNPTQEFNGFYPPPFGPKEYAEGGPNINYFTNKTDEALAIKALADFHFDRLHIFASHESWDMIDCIAMETVPLVWEVVAIREAICRLQRYLSTNHKPPKPWWISFVFPDAVPVQQNVRMFDYVDASLSSSPSVMDPTVIAPVPNGIGLNCVDIGHLPSLVLEFRQALNSQRRQVLKPGNLPQDQYHVPWLVLYPNGSHFDIHAKEWSKVSDESWAQELAALVGSLWHNISETPRIPGIMVGGCCKTGPGAIHRLSQLIAQQ